MVAPCCTCVGQGVTAKDLAIQHEGAWADEDTMKRSLNLADSSPIFLASKAATVYFIMGKN
jgi:hypothetical protein